MRFCGERFFREAKGDICEGSYDLGLLGSDRSYASTSNGLSRYRSRPRNHSQTEQPKYAGMNKGPRISYCLTWTCSWSRTRSRSNLVWPRIVCPSVIPTTPSRERIALLSPPWNSRHPRWTLTPPPKHRPITPTVSPSNELGAVQKYATPRQNQLLDGKNLSLTNSLAKFWKVGII